MSADLNELRKVAEAANPGPWRADDEHGDMPGATPAWCVSRTNEDGDYLGDLAWMPQDVNGKDKPNATHIATFDPPTVLALLSRLEQAEQAVEKSKRACEALGRVIEIDGANLVKLTDSQELVDADGDGDWEEIWGIAFDLKDRATKAEQQVARVREALTEVQGRGERIRAKGNNGSIYQQERAARGTGYLEATRLAFRALDGETRG